MQKKEVDISFPAVRISINGKNFVQPASKVSTKDITNSIYTQITELQKLLNKALETYTVDITQPIKTSLHIETSATIKQKYPSLPNALFQTITIKFNDKLHNQLYKIQSGWTRRTKSKDILYYLGLIDNTNRITAAGIAILNSLNTNGPDNSIRNVIAIGQSLTGIDSKDSPIKHYVMTHNYHLYKHFNTYTQQEKGIAWLQQNAKRILKSKRAPAALKVKLLPFASLDILPAFLTSDDEMTRQAAKARFDELKSQENINITIELDLKNGEGLEPALSFLKPV